MYVCIYGYTEQPPSACGTLIPRYRKWLLFFLSQHYSPWANREEWENRIKILWVSKKKKGGGRKSGAYMKSKCWWLLPKEVLTVLQSPASTQGFCSTVLRNQISPYNPSVYSGTFWLPNARSHSGTQVWSCLAGLHRFPPHPVFSLAENKNGQKRFNE